jgi:hypothetical protein
MKGSARVARCRNTANSWFYSRTTGWVKTTAFSSISFFDVKFFHEAVHRAGVQHIA